MMLKFSGIFCMLFLSLLVIAAGAECAVCQGAATPAPGGPSTPITLDVSISRVPLVGENAVITATVTSIFDAPGTTVTIKIPEGAELVGGALSGTYDLVANSPQSMEATIRFTTAGDYTIEVLARHVVDDSSVWGDLKALYLTIGVSNSMYTPPPTDTLHPTTQTPPVLPDTVPAAIPPADISQIPPGLPVDRPVVRSTGTVPAAIPPADISQIPPGLPVDRPVVRSSVLIPNATTDSSPADQAIMRLIQLMQEIFSL